MHKLARLAVVDLKWQTNMTAMRWRLMYACIMNAINALNDTDHPTSAWNYY